MIELKDIRKTYALGGELVHALDGVSLSIGEGEFMAIVGPSGSGKSTLMNILGCLDVPTSGSYLFEGKDISSYRSGHLADIRNRKIGFIFQGFNLLPKLSALENVELPLIYKGMFPARRVQAANEALEAVGLKDRARHKPSQLSGGQQQRVAIARALVTRPKIILADEPTGNLDSKSGAEVMELLKQLNSEGTTVVLITHDNEVARSAHRIIRIFDGKIVEDTGVDGKEADA